LCPSLYLATFASFAYLLLQSGGLRLLFLVLPALPLDLLLQA
jgi:hypothetical protein